MTPTAKIRWLKLPMTETVAFERPSAQQTPFGQSVIVLQQWWVSREPIDLDTEIPKGEWRDVPIEEQA